MSRLKYLNYLILYFSGILLFLHSCKTNTLNKSNPAAKIEFEKTGCLNKCKAYKLSVSNTGYATYEGILNVTKTGKHAYQLPRKANQNFWRLVNKDSLLKMNESYNYGDEDTQQHFLKYYESGKLTKEVRFGPFPPKQLIRLEKQLDSIAEFSKWKAIR